MDNLALMPVENYGFWHECRSKELFKVISIFSPYCFVYESELFLANGTTIPDIEDYERLLEAIGDDIKLHPYMLAEKLPEAPWLGDTAVLAVTAQLRVLWHKRRFRGVLSRNRNVFQTQFGSGLSPTQDRELMSSIKTLAKMVNG